MAAYLRTFLILAVLTAMAAGAASAQVLYLNYAHDKHPGCPTALG